MSESDVPSTPVPPAPAGPAPNAASTPEPEPSNTTGRMVLLASMTCTVIAALMLLGYDRWIRVPQTPRFGTVDVGQIFAANQAVAVKKLLSGAQNVPADALGAQAGQDMAKQLQDYSRRCGCLLIASPAVFGTTSTVADHTTAIKAVYGLNVDPAEFRVPTPPAVPTAPSTPHP